MHERHTRNSKASLLSKQNMSFSERTNFTFQNILSEIFHAYKNVCVDFFNKCIRILCLVCPIPFI